MSILDYSLNILEEPSRMTNHLETGAYWRG